MRHLPPLKAVRAFEAAARLQSFTAAAEELGVTQSAVSRQIRIMEAFLGTRLFRPSGRGLTPTGQARIYASELGLGLDRMSLATERIAEPKTVRQLRINALPTFTMKWLIPRLSSFQRMHPNLDVKLSTSVRPVHDLTESFDVAIRRYPMQVPGYESRAFMEDRSLPVCSPALMEQSPIRAPEDVLNHTLLFGDVSSADWEEWLSHVGLEKSPIIKRQRFANFFVVLQAASEGLGVALGPSTLVADDIEAGHLIAPLQEPALPCRPFEILYPVDERRTQRTDAFVNWLIEETGRM